VPKQDQVKTYAVLHLLPHPTFPIERHQLQESLSIWVAKEYYRQLCYQMVIALASNKKIIEISEKKLKEK